MPSHTHHWRLEPPVPGIALVKGRCWLCGEVGEWPAYEVVRGFNKARDDRKVKA